MADTKTPAEARALLSVSTTAEVAALLAGKANTADVLSAAQVTAADAAVRLKAINVGVTPVTITGGNSNAMLATAETGAIVDGSTFTFQAPGTTTVSNPTIRINAGNTQVLVGPSGEVITAGQITAGKRYLAMRIDVNTARLLTFDNRADVLAETAARIAADAALAGVRVDLTTADGASARNVNAYATPPATVRYNSCQVFNPPAGAPTGDVRATLDVAFSGLGGIRQTLEYQDASGNYDRTFIRYGVTDSWQEITPYEPPAKSTVNISALGLSGRNFNILLNPDILYTFDGSTLCTNGPPQFDIDGNGDGTSYYAGEMVVQNYGHDRWLQKYWDGDPLVPTMRVITTSGTMIEDWAQPYEPIVIPDAGPALVSLGDSITAGTGAGANSPDAYRNRIATLLNASLDNYAVVGRMMVGTVTGDLNERLADATVRASITAADMVWIAYGTNDYSGNVPLGVLGSTDPTTFFGAMQAAYDTIRGLKPTIRICFLTPIYRGVAYSDPDNLTEPTAPNSAGVTLEQYRIAIRSFVRAKRWASTPDTNIALIEMHGASGPIDAANAYQAMSNDELHPSVSGHRAMAEHFVKWMNLLGWYGG